jgi:hypothetical protein
LTSYTIDVALGRSEKVAQKVFNKAFVRSERSLSHLILAAGDIDDSHYALNPLSLEKINEWKSKRCSHGQLDDYILNDKNEITDLLSAEKQWLKL